MAAAFRLLVPIPFALLVIVFSVGIVLLEVFVPYERYSLILRWLALSIFAYVIELFAEARTTNAQRCWPPYHARSTSSAGLPKGVKPPSSGPPTSVLALQSHQYIPANHGSSQTDSKAAR